jgi:hypothetical protein
MAADAVFDTAGIVNGRPGEIVCRVQLLAAQGAPAGALDRVRPARAICVTRNTAAARSNQCAPLNVFGKGNQSAEALEFIDAVIGVTERQRAGAGLAVGLRPISGTSGVPARSAWPSALNTGKEYDRGHRPRRRQHRPTACCSSTRVADFAPVGVHQSKEWSSPNFRSRCSVTAGWASTPNSAVPTAMFDYSTVGDVRRLRREPGLPSDPGHRVQDELQHLVPRART